mmetsp:Transcript_26504/g.41110  ORF Transcript_26504/g.41110 Transcript_26504/m.41110 type:complete len:123 (-) Transcript_26504:356-724(-)
MMMETSTKPRTTVTPNTPITSVQSGLPPTPSAPQPSALDEISSDFQEQIAKHLLRLPSLSENTITSSCSTVISPAIRLKQRKSPLMSSNMMNTIDLMPCVCDDDNADKILVHATGRKYARRN